MPLMWFLAGVVTTVASLIVLSPWLRRMSNWSFIAAEMVVLIAAIGVYFASGRSETAPISVAVPASTSTSTRRAFASAAQAIDAAADKPAAAVNSSPAADPAAAGSMDSAVANLESRLAKGGGSADDWELLARSFDFLGRPAEAAQARAHQLPASGAAPAAGASDASALSGEVTLAAALKDKAMPGETLFIVAKSVDSPGMPVAVIRASVGGWPLRFTLDDSQSMMPGRTLSSAGRVTVEARISRQGQPLPARGDLEGSTGIIDPSNRRPLKIIIDREIS
jgi:hypothetical protein